MGIFDSKTKQINDIDTTTVTDTDQLDQSGNEGLNLGQVGGSAVLDLSSTTNLTDASQTSTTIQTNYLDGGSLTLAGDISRQALAVAGGGVANASAANAGALQFGSQALSQVADLNANSLQLFASLVGDAFDNSRTLARDAIDASANALAKFSDFSSTATADAVAGFGALAKQGAESTDDKVSKVAMYGLAAIVAAMVLPQLFKGARA